MKGLKHLVTLTLALALLSLCSATAFASSSAELDSMEIIGSDGETYLDEDDFDADETDYELELDEDVTYLKLYLDYDSDYEVEVDYDNGTVTELSSYWRIYVDEDDPDEITVTIYDPDDEEDEEIYTIELSCDESSGDGTEELEDLYLNTGNEYSSRSSYEVDLLPSFDSDITDYAVLLPYDEDLEYLNLRISLEDDDVDLEIEGSSISLSDDYYDYAFAIPDEGDTESVDFTVDDCDYTITVYYAEDGADDEAYLDDLAIRSKKTTSSSYDLDLSPTFDEDEEEYDLDLDSDYSTLYLYAEADDEMIIFVEGEPLSSYWSFDPEDYDEITVTVYAADYEAYTEYTINLDDEANAALNSLYLYSGTSGSVTLSPAFSAAKYNYTAQVDTSVSTLSIYASSSATVKIAQNGGSYVTASSSYATYSLNTGLNTFDILVGSDTHYYLNIYRPASTTTIVSSSQYLSLNGGTAQQIAAYNINGNNFVKLRDVAYLLSGTAKQFSVSYSTSSNLISLYTGGSYVNVGGEMSTPGAYSKALVTSQSIYLDSGYVYPMAYNIDGNNYFLLRDLAALFDFGIDFSGNTVYVYTDRGYGDEEATDDEAGDFSDLSMKVLDDEGETCLSKSDFDYEEDEYDLEVNEDISYLQLHLYYDEDLYSVTVKYDGSTSDVSLRSYSSTSQYGLYRVYVDTDDLDEITVTVENEDGDKETYTLNLEVE